VHCRYKFSATKYIPFRKNIHSYKTGIDGLERKPKAMTPEIDGLERKTTMSPGIGRFKKTHIREKQEEALKENTQLRNQE
jgi:hypothetical protein